MPIGNAIMATEKKASLATVALSFGEKRLALIVESVSIKCTPESYDQECVANMNKREAVR